MINTPNSDKIIRERTFPITGLREDGKDVIAQVIITLGQLFSENMTGQIAINISQGTVSSIQVKETQRLPI